MSVVLNIFKWTTFAAIGLVVLAFMLVAYDMSFGPSYDDDDPRYSWLADQRNRVREALESGIGSTRFDVSSLNDGEWSTACIFGGYNDPIEEMVHLGARVSDKDRAKLNGLKVGFRLSQVEEFEIMFAFIDLTGTAHFIHFEHGVGSGGQHLEKCITKPQTVIDLRDA